MSLIYQAIVVVQQHGIPSICVVTIGPFHVLYHGYHQADQQHAAKRMAYMH